MFLLYVFILGTAVGSFLNVLIDRLPQDRSIMGRSHCDHCGRTLQPQDLIPVASFIFLKGRCRRCNKQIPSIYPFIEVLTGLAFVLVWLYLPVDTIVLKVLYMGIVASLIVIFFADLKYQIIPDQIQLILFLLSFGIIGNNWHNLEMQALAGVVVMVPLLLLFLVTKGRGMGFGDVKLAFTLGFLLGMPGGLMALYIAFITGAVYGVGVIISGNKNLKSKVAFGPFMVAGMLVMIFFGAPLLSAVRSWYGI